MSDWHLDFEENRHRYQYNRKVGEAVQHADDDIVGLSEGAIVWEFVVGECAAKQTAKRTYHQDMA